MFLVGSLVLANPAADRLAECFADAFDRNPVEHLLEEAGDDHADRLIAGHAAAAAVEDLLVVDAAAGRRVGAADVVGFDFESRDRIGACLGRQQQVVVPLVAVGLWALGSTPIIPRQTVRERSCRAAL